VGNQAEKVKVLDILRRNESDLIIPVNVVDADELRRRYNDASYWKTYSTNYKFKPRVVIKKKLTKTNNDVK
jgi:hypothetical protein